MPTDYVLFNHGVSTREERFQPTYADGLFELIQQYYNASPACTERKRTLHSIPLYWGEVNKDQEDLLLKAYRDSPTWEQLWFREFREKQLMQFVGDGALYISRLGGANVAQKLLQKAADELQGYDSEHDLLHIVTHSMGTVILFDMLFSARWDPVDAPGHNEVTAMRAAFFGISAPETGAAPPDAIAPAQIPSAAVIRARSLLTEKGVLTGSISTMGSPIGFFSLTAISRQRRNDKDLATSATHDITPRLEQFLAQLSRRLGKKLPWYNFVHPGDPVAYPLEIILPQLVDGDSEYLTVKDILTHPAVPTDFLAEFVNLLPIPLALFHGGAAHGSYWQSDQVAQAIADAIASASKPLQV